MLADERQRAYKSNKSTIDVIYRIKRSLVKKQCKWRILLALSKAFGRIDSGVMEHFIWERSTHKPFKANKKMTFGKHAA